MKTTQFKLSGLSCEACTKIIKKRVGKLPDISEINVDIQGNLEIKADRDLDKKEVITALRDTDYKVL